MRQSGGHRQLHWYSDESVGDHPQCEEAIRPDEAPEPDAGSPADGLGPAETLFDAIAAASANGISLMPRGAAINEGLAHFLPDVQILALTAMWGVTFCSLSLSTQSTPSKPLSALSVTRALRTVLLAVLRLRSIMASAASRSAVLVALVSSQSTTSPLLFSKSAWPIKQRRLWELIAYRLIPLFQTFVMTRASHPLVNPYLAAVKQLEHSSGKKSLQMLPMALQSSSVVLAAVARRCALSLAKAISMGLRSGLKGGRNRSQTPRARMAFSARS